MTVTSNHIFRMAMSSPLFSTELRDVDGKPWVIQPAGQQPVYFNYNSVGDNTRVYSSVANDWERDYTYDWLGRRLTYAEGELAESYTYNGGNLSTHTQSWSENGLPQTKTTHYHYNAHRLDSVCYEDALTTIYHYNAAGQPDSVYDESGVMCYEYGNMGEVTKETRIYALPFLSQPIALSTQYNYDSWGRVQSITYPDGEVVNYAYDLGGQLERMYNSSYTYLGNVTYDRFGAKVSQEYGNGIATSYSYNNTTRRLSGITTANQGVLMSDIAYTYDPVGNVTQVTGTCPWLPNRTFTESFTYDAADQLVSASETGSNSYRLSVSYGTWGRVNTYDLTQTDLLQNHSFSNAATQNTYVYDYPGPGNLQDAQTVFAPAQRDIVGNSNAVTESFTFGINGSLRRRDNPQQSVTEYYLHNSSGNLKAYSNSGWNFAYYGYNASNTRTYKLSMLNQNQWTNGQPEPIHLQLQNAMFYPNAYLTFNSSGNYTKHYYAGTERICSRLGDQTFSLSSNVAFTPQTQQRLGTRIMQVDQNFRAELLELVEAGDVPVEFPNVLNLITLLPANPNANSHSHSNTSNDIFYYHTNHLGSTAFVTDNNASVTQGFLYAPFGEIVSEYNAGFANGIMTKYSFNAKELDEETGMYYYEARYMAPPTFISRDPMFEQKPWLSPYHYCSNNPLKFVDPTGEKIVIVGEDGVETTYEPGMTYDGNDKFTSDAIAGLNFLYNNPEGEKNRVADIVNAEPVLTIIQQSIGKSSGSVLKSVSGTAIFSKGVNSL